MNMLDGDVTSVFECMYKYHCARNKALTRKLNDKTKETTSARDRSRKDGLQGCFDLMPTELKHEKLSGFVTMAEKVLSDATVK